MPPNRFDATGTLFFKNIQTKKLTTVSEDNSQTGSIVLKQTGDEASLVYQPISGAESTKLSFSSNAVKLRSATGVEIGVNATGTVGISGGVGGAPSTSMVEIGTGTTKFRLVANGDALEVFRFVDGSANPATPLAVFQA
eukprot:jgi/Mesvir1/19867/Mv13157-RA.1